MLMLIVHLFFLIGLLTAGVLYGVCVFAFASPRAFAQWFTPFYWLTRKILKSSKEKYDRIFSFSIGAASLFVLLMLQFILGGIAVTGLFDLWTSPYAILFRAY